MKKILFLSIALFAFNFSEAQANKPDKGAFGVGFGVNYNGSFSPNLDFRYIISPRFEVGLGLGLGHSSQSNITTDSVNVLTKNFTTIPGFREVSQKNTNTTVNINPFLLYHFNIKSNLDLFLGLRVGVRINAPAKTENKTTVTASDYSDITTGTKKGGITFGLGSGLILGANYFFYKNLALNATCGLGFSYNNTVAKSSYTYTETSSGGNTLNTTVTNTTYTTPAGTKTVDLALAGNAGLSLLYYFGGKAK